MYYISRIESGSLDKVHMINTDTFLEEEIPLETLFKVAESGMLLPNNKENGICIAGSSGITSEVSALCKVRSTAVRLTDRVEDFTVDLFGKSTFMYCNVSTAKNSWRHSGLCCQGCGITVLGTGDTVYVHQNDKIYVCTHLDILMGVFFLGESLYLRNKANYYESEVLLEGSVGECYSWVNETVEIRRGGIKEMKRMALLERV